MELTFNIKDNGDNSFEIVCENYDLDMYFKKSFISCGLVMLNGIQDLFDNFIQDSINRNKWEKILAGFVIGIHHYYNGNYGTILISYVEDELDDVSDHANTVVDSIFKRALPDTFINYNSGNDINLKYIMRDTVNDYCEENNIRIVWDRDQLKLTFPDE